MRFIFAFKAEPLQLKFLNWALDRTDIDKAVMQKSVVDKDKNFTDAIARFVEFQGEVKKYALKIANMTSIFTIGNSSNIFLDCIYEQCANDDDSFKYVFGDDKDESRCKSHFRKALDSLYDAFKNSMEFSTEGKFKKRAQEVFNGFKNKKMKLEKLVSDMDKILADNNKNQDDENDERTFEEKEKDSWENLEENEVFTRGVWHVYQVDKYEDMRNVASKCSDWCVARADSGRGYFYNTYNPPYYLFCKGRRNPYILMHIDSQQFKGLDDQKFEADRPTSYEAIEIGREFLKKIRKFNENNYSNDFSVFNENDENGLNFDRIVGFTNNIEHYSSSDEDLKRIYEMTGNPETIDCILRNTGDVNLIMEILDKAGDNYQEYIDRLLTRDTLVSKLGKEDAFKVYCRIVDEAEDSQLKKNLLNSILANCHDKDVILKVFERYGMKEQIAELLVKNHYFMNVSEIECVLDDRDAILKIYGYVRDKLVALRIIEKYHDDYDIMILKIKKYDKSIDYWTMNEDEMEFLIEKTNNPRLIEDIIKCTFNDAIYMPQYSHYEKMRSTIWNSLCKNLERFQIDEKLKESFVYKMKEHFEEIGSSCMDVTQLLLNKSTNKDESFKLLDSKSMQYEVMCRYFDEHIDNMKYEGTGKGEDWKFFDLFAEKLWAREEEKFHRLFEKTNYNKIIMLHAKHRPPTAQHVQDVDKCVSKCSSLSINDAKIFYQHITIEYEQWIDSEESPKVALKIIEKCQDKDDMASYIVNETRELEFSKKILFDYNIDAEAFEKLVMRLQKGDLDEDLLEKYSRKLANECKQGNRNSGQSLYKLMAVFNLPDDVVGEISKLEDSDSDKVHKTYRTCLIQAANLEELKRGHIEDKDKFVEDWCNCYNNVKDISHLLKTCAETGDYFYTALHNIIVKSNSIDEDDKCEIMHYMFYLDLHGIVNLSKFIPWCLEKEEIYLCIDILQTKHATEEEIETALTIIGDDNLDLINKNLYSFSMTAKKVILEKEKEGEFESGSIEWNLHGMATNKDCTTEELELACEIIEHRMSGDGENEGRGSGDYDYWIDWMLLNEHCTQEIADRLIDLIEDRYEFIDNYGISSLYRWLGDDVFDEENADSYENYANAARDAKEGKNLESLFEHVIEYGPLMYGDYPEDYDDGYDEDDCIDNIVDNEACTVDLFLRIFARYEENDDGERNRQIMKSFIDSHKDMSSETASALLEKCDSVFSKESNLVDDFLQCKNLTEEQLIAVFNKYKTVGKGYGSISGWWVIANKNYTYKALLSALDYMDDDWYMPTIVDSDKANEEVYRKVFDMKAGKRSLLAVAEKTTDENMKNEIQKVVSERGEYDYGVVYDINHETDVKKLEKLVVKYFQKYSVKDYSLNYHFGDEETISNQKAIEMLSKTSNQRILHIIIKNPNAPEKTVLSILKKNQTKDNLYLAAKRSEKSILMYVCCMTRSEDDITTILKKYPKMFDVDEVMTMIKWNASCKFVILKHTLLMFDKERLLSLRKLNDKDMNWIIDNVLKNSKGVSEAKAGRIIDRILKASRITRNIMLYKGEKDENTERL